MSIRLEIKDYCHNCLDFEADVTKPERMYAENDVVGVYGDTIVRCEYRNRCKGIKRYLEQKMKGEQKD